MSNDYYNSTGKPGSFSLAKSSEIRTELAAIQAGFALLPPVTDFTAMTGLVDAAPSLAVNDTIPVVEALALVAKTPSQLKVILGLEHVDNTHDADKIVSTLQAVHAARTDNPHTVTKAQVGLGDCDNTPDASKPVSTPQATAIAAINSNKNRIINGAMAVDQERAGVAVTPAASIYVMDQYIADVSQASKLTFQQVVDAPAGFKYSQKITVAAQFNPAATDYFLYKQPIEGQNIIDMQFGQAGAATITFSNYIKGSVAGTYSCFLKNVSNGRAYIGTISVTTSWARVQFALIADTSGTWPIDNTAGLVLGIDLGSGSNFNTAAGAWQSGNFLRTAGSLTFVNQVNGSTLNITGAQLEKGSAATDFEVIPYAEQLRMCQIYYESLDGFAIYGYMVAGQTIMSPVAFKVTKRTTPSMGLLGWTTAQNATAQTFFSTTTNGSLFGVNAVASGVTEMRGCTAYANARL